MRRFFTLFIAICISLNINAQITKQQATSLVMNTIVGNKIDSVNVFVQPTILSSDYYVVSSIDSTILYQHVPQWIHGEYTTANNSTALKSLFALEENLNDDNSSLRNYYLTNETVEGELPTITNLEISNVSTLFSNYTFLTWNTPESIVLDEHLLSWSNGYCINALSIGIQQERDMAHRFTQDDIKDYDGWRIKKVGFVFLSENNEHILKIWNKSNDEFNLIYEELLDNDSLIVSTYENGVWDYIDIKEDIYLDSEKELWVGFASNGTDYYIFPVDESDEGDEDNWIKLGEEAWDNYFASHFGNLSIQTIIENSDGKTTSLDSDKTLTGYRVYANGELIKEIESQCITYYLDFKSNTDIKYCVTAVYGDSESEPLCVGFVSEEEIYTEESSLDIHPNPTNGKVMIENVEIDFVDLYNIHGQYIRTYNTNEIDLEDLPSGMYLLIVKDKAGNIYADKVIRFGL